MERKTLTAVIYLLAAVAFTWMLLSRQLNDPSRLEYVLGFAAAAFFWLAAALVSRRPKFAHSCAVGGLVALPWVYTAILQGHIYVNYWTVFNAPDRDLLAFNGLLRTELTIVAVALTVFAIATGILRLLPARWVLREMPLNERTWPAVAASFCFLAIWFSQSVMPYRIPGALDYSSWPMLQILHVQKHGLRFRETCIKVWGYRGMPQSPSVVAWNDRRLFEYRFQQRSADVTIPQSVVERVASLILSSKTVKSNREAIRPLRGWDDEGWYVIGEEVTFQAYSKENQSTPPQEVIDLFEDVKKLPRTQVTSVDRKDVCLGFCYDQLAALGALYANHRCRYEETSRDYVCR